MPELTDEGKRDVAEIASRHGTSTDAATQFLHALSNGGGWQAQFNISELGGMGQWSSGGMVMVGDMFNNSLRAKVDALGNDLAALLRSSQPFKPEARGGRGGPNWWPAELGHPASAGSQNQTRYAFFPDTRRLAIDDGNQITVYDTGDHHLGGFGQQQSGSGTMSFSSQYGSIHLGDLPVVSPVPEHPPVDAPRPSRTVEAEPDRIEDVPPAPTTQMKSMNNPGPASAAPEPAPSPTANFAGSGEDVLAKIERLAELRDRGIVTDEEFTEKKAELLRRL